MVNCSTDGNPCWREGKVKTKGLSQSQRNENLWQWTWRLWVRYREERVSVSNRYELIGTWQQSEDWRKGLNQKGGRQNMTNVGGPIKKKITLCERVLKICDSVNWLFYSEFWDWVGSFQKYIPSREYKKKELRGRVTYNEKRDKCVQVYVRIRGKCPTLSVHVLLVQKE